jgi:hypothetical protein
LVQKCFGRIISDDETLLESLKDCRERGGRGNNAEEEDEKNGTDGYAHRYMRWTGLPQRK